MISTPRISVAHTHTTLRGLPVVEVIADNILVLDSGAIEEEW